ncbi:MAG: 1-acyl-sn-glycerol-3-phosphate acyltransferase [Bdellovibrionales bacterium]
MVCFQKTAVPAQKLGFIEATSQNGLRALKNNQLIILFPEGENGNFKPTKNAYELQEFKRGFVRMALETRTPIIPTLVIGAEETHINLTQLRFGKELKNLVLPIPFNVFPLPVRWKIKFLPPVDLSHFSADTINDREKVRKIAANIQKDMQKSLIKELENREGIFVKRPSWLQDFLKNINKKF